MSTQLPQMPVRYINETKPGKCNALNSGMSHTTGQVIIFTDDDVRVPSDWVHDISRPILDEKQTVVSGGVRIAQHLRRDWMAPIHHRFVSSTECEPEINPFLLVGANMALSRQVLKDVPSFDPELGPGALGLGDDTLFAFQLVQAGHELFQATRIVCEHHFEPERLLHYNLLRSARTRGISSAYVKWHWNHETPKSPWFMLLHAQARLCKWRAKHHSPPPRSEGAAEVELRMVRKVAFFRQMLRERRRPRNYTYRGLVKLCSP